MKMLKYIFFNYRIYDRQNVGGVETTSLSQLKQHNDSIVADLSHLRRRGVVAHTDDLLDGLATKDLSLCGNEDGN